METDAPMSSSSSGPSEPSALTIPAIPALPAIPTLRPIGIVRSPVGDIKKMPRGGVEAVIELDHRYASGLQRIEEHSNIWVLSWFHESESARDTLIVNPVKEDPTAFGYGVFGMRANRRPNPIALSLVDLLGVDGNRVRVRGLDAIDGTPVLDIKSYWERDVIFSPRAPVLRPKERQTRWRDLVRLGKQHHQETCTDFYLGMRMALIAEEALGKLTALGLTVQVEGSRCLGDSIQGITHARLANPARFTFAESASAQRSEWRSGDAGASADADAGKGNTDGSDTERVLRLHAREAAVQGRPAEMDAWAPDAISDEELFEIEGG